MPADTAEALRRLARLRRAIMSVARLSHMPRNVYDLLVRIDEEVGEIQELLSA